MENRSLDLLTILELTFLTCHKFIYTYGLAEFPSNSSAMNIMRLMEDGKTAEWLFENGTPQNIANCVWACATLGITSPSLFRLLDGRNEWLFANITPQNIANCVWACGTLGITSPHLFRLLNDHTEWLVQEGTPQTFRIAHWLFLLWEPCRQCFSQHWKHA